MKHLESVKLVQFLLYESQEFRLGETSGLFGANGSGKSTALDAVQIALFGANKSSMAFNAQADSSGSRKARTLRSYCLGQYGDDATQCVRTNAITYITLTWRNQETGEPITAGICIEASIDSEDTRVLGRYVITGLELAMVDHLQTVDGIATPLPWSSFRHRLLERAKIVGENPLFDDASSFTKQILFALRGKAGQPSYDAFIRAFRFALRMRFDKPVDQIVRQDVLESRPTNINKFKSIVETFKRLSSLVEAVEHKIEGGKKIAAAFHGAQNKLRQAASLRYLGALAEEENAQLKCELAQEELEKGQQTAEQLRSTSEEMQRQLDVLEQELSHLEDRQKTHAAHQDNVTAQIDQNKAIKRLQESKASFKKELNMLSAMIRQWGASPHLAEWKQQLHELDVQIQFGDSAPQQGPSDSLQASLQQMLSLSSQISEKLDLVRLQRTSHREELEEKIGTLKSSLERADQGKAPLSSQTQKLIDELKDYGLAPTPVCDLVEITDTRWQPAIEAYLAKNVEALLLPVEQEEQAFDIYRALQGRRVIHGVKIVRSAQVNHAPISQSGLVSKLIEGSNQAAVSYLQGQLGNLKCADQSQEALRSDRTLTEDGMYVSPKDFERLRLDSSYLRIGKGGRAQADRLRSEIKDFEHSLANVNADIELLTPMYKSASGLPEQIRLLQNLWGNNRAALKDSELADQRVAGIKDAEYKEICSQIVERERDLTTLKGQVKNADKSAMEAELQLPILNEKCGSTAFRHQQCIQFKKICKEHIDFDESFASSQWDKLLEQFGDPEAMVGYCKKRAEEIEPKGQKEADRARSELWTYQQEHREYLSEEISQDWRKGKAWIDEHVAKLINTELPAHKEQADEAYQASQDTFRQDVAIALNTNLQFLKQTFDRLNAALRKTPPFSNGERYQFVYKVRPELTPLLDFIKSVAEFGVNGGLFGDPGNIPPQFEELLREKTISGAGAVKSPLDDYREFYSFDVRIERVEPDGATKTVGHLSKRIGPGSGGEHRAPLYVIAGASLWSAYRMDQGDRDGLRLILLDEAFDKMDPSNVISTMKYLQELGLQVLMASPGENLGTLNAFLNCYFEIQKDPVRHAIQVDRFEVTELMREQFREDLWEFNPELLEQELEAIKVAKTSVTSPALNHQGVP